MTILTHMRCDRCTDDDLINPRKLSTFDTGWARVSVGFEEYDICPNCWKEIAEYADLKPKKESHE